MADRDVAPPGEDQPARRPAQWKPPADTAGEEHFPAASGGRRAPASWRHRSRQTQTTGMVLLFAAGVLVGGGLALAFLAPPQPQPPQPPGVVAAAPAVRPQAPRAARRPSADRAPQPLALAAARRSRRPRVVADRPAEPAAPPVRLRIARMDVNERLVGLRVQTDGTLASPADFDDPGWYRDGVAPGDRGPAVIVGHVDSFDGPAIFFQLASLRSGDKARIRRADGTTVTFVVDRVERFAKDDFPTQQVYGPTKRPELRLITCGGGFNETTRHYDDNVVAFASLAVADKLRAGNSGARGSDRDGGDRGKARGSDRDDGDRVEARRSDRRPPPPDRRG